MSVRCSRVTVAIALALTFGSVVTASASSGPTLVRDILPGSKGSDPEFFIKLSSTTELFSAHDGTHGIELWKTDGTAAGTTMVKDINPGSAGSTDGGLVAFNGDVYFPAFDASHGDELWKSDGSAAGTRLVKDIYA